MKAYTDYPFRELGDIPYEKAPIRECEIFHYDGDKYLYINIGEHKDLEVKRFYVYKNEARLGEGEINFTMQELKPFEK